MAAVFTTMGWMEKTEKGVKDLFMGGGVAKKTVVLEGEVEEVETDRMISRLVEVVEGTPEGAVETMTMILVEEEVLIMLEKISKMNAVITQLVMAK